jgi:hypothetical protein
MLLHPLSPAEAPPLGDMPLAPFAMTKRTEADLAQAMVEHLRATGPASGSEALERDGVRLNRFGIPKSGGF